MPKILIATESNSVYDDVVAAVDDEGTTIHRVTTGSGLAPSVAEVEPDVVICDLQISNMGGVAATINLRHEQGAGRLPDARVVLLIDRDADVFLAEQSGADAWVTKPFAPRALARIVRSMVPTAR